MVSKIQDTIQEIINSAVAEGLERGLQVAAYHRGRLIVDAHAGIADINTGAPVTKTTLFPVFSATKGITATAIHLLAERGILAYEDKISGYWPEFGVSGKENVTVLQALHHTSGIPQLPVELTAAEMADWDNICRIIASLSPLWEPGSRMEYHALNYGWILGELARRADGRHFGQIITEDICMPLGIEDDLYVGVPADMEHRVAFLEEPGVTTDKLNDGGIVTIPDGANPLPVWMNLSEVRRSCQPGASGVMSAHALARVYGALLPGGVDGVELLPPSRVNTAIKPLELPQDDLPPVALGYRLGGEDILIGESPLVFGHGGYGCNLGIADLRYGLAFGFTRNLITPASDGFSKKILDTVRASVRSNG